jgi:stage II sporulation protein D
MRAILLSLVLVGCAAQPVRAPIEATAPPTTSVIAAPAPVVAPAIAVKPAAIDPLALPPPPLAPHEELYAKRLDFRGGEPTVPVRLMENAREVTFSPRGRMRLKIDGELPKTLEAPAGSRWRVRILQGTPAVMREWIQLGEYRFADHAGLEAEEARWKEHGVATRRETLGSVYGIAGKVIDNRRWLLLVATPFDEAAARARQAELLTRFGAHTTRYEEIARPPHGALEVLDGQGASVAIGEGRIVAETLGGEGFEVLQVEHNVGYPAHGFEDRSYRGALELAPDSHGQLAVVNLVALEDLLKGLVPSEIFSRAPAEALKAQAVTARGEVLAKIGLQHLSDPYLLCSEQHCAVYKGRLGETPATNAAVDATRGEALFSQEGRLVDSVYSAVCGGHTESNENVWGGPPDPNLRGRPDVLEERPGAPSPRELADFLASREPAACRLSSFAQPAKFRWERRFTQAEIDTLTQSLGVGDVQAISVIARGVSGRATRIVIAGEGGATEVQGELNIRRTFGMLNSAMFVVSTERDRGGRPVAWVFKGGGWGHGVGMCQTGAIGRAEAGQTYRAILRFYFSGAEVARIY